MTPQQSSKYPKHHASKFYVGRAAARNVNNNAWTNVQYDTVVIDVLQEYNTTVANAFQPIEAGYYFLQSSAIMLALAIGDTFAMRFYVNGVFQLANREILCHAVGQNPTLTIEALAYLTPNDFVESRVWHNFGAARNTGGNQWRDHFCGFRVG